MSAMMVVVVIVIVVRYACVCWPARASRAILHLALDDGRPKTKASNRRKSLTTRRRVEATVT